MLTGWLGQRSMEKSARDAAAFERQSMWLQMLLRGVNESILTGGTPDSIEITRKAIDGFDGMHRVLLSDVSQKPLRDELEGRVDARWQAIKAGLAPFLRENAVSEKDAVLMAEYGRLIVEGENLITDMHFLSALAREHAADTARNTQLLIGLIAALIILGMASVQVDLYRSIAIPVRKLKALMADISGKDTGGFKSEQVLLLSERLDDKEKRLSSRIMDISELSESFDSMIMALNSHIGERVRVQGELEMLATVDELTQAFNRTKFEELIEAEIDRTQRFIQPLSIIIFDLDHFKMVNDSFGHLTGDYVLQTVASIVKAGIRETDYLVRWGGEEFLVLAPNADIDKAQLLAERLRSVISEHVFEHIGRITASFGVAVYRECETKDAFILRADNAMYRAKRTRNRVEQAA